MQNPAESFPCFGQYDIAIMIIAFIVGIVSTGLLVFDIYRLIRR